VKSIVWKIYNRFVESTLLIFAVSNRLKLLAWHRGEEEEDDQGELEWNSGRRRGGIEAENEDWSGVV